ncbi:hypothetical protein BRC82_07475 [Halobacteriales archaeon QS_1_67_19]|nr:MAG: hypothetical protein BRC82_07475 [Halobacteriales archaeon QS_1_67_19]
MPETQTEPVQSPDREHESSAASHELRSVVVNYECRPDRRTVYPAGASGIERMSAWLTADANAFVELHAHR